MLKFLPILLAIAAPALVLADTETDARSQILALERRAMDGWRDGNPDPALAACDPDITWFHAVTDRRVDGLAALKDIYERFRGRPLFDRYEIVDPRVQFAGEAAVLTYRFVRYNGAVASYWNATEVYHRTQDGWRILHTHFSEAPRAQP